MIARIPPGGEHRGTLSLSVRWPGNCPVPSRQELVEDFGRRAILRILRDASPTSAGLATRYRAAEAALSSVVSPPKKTGGFRARGSMPLGVGGSSFVD